MHRSALDFLKHAFVILLLFIAWKYLTEWYLYRGTPDYLLFSLFFLGALFLAVGSHIRQFTEIPWKRQAALLFLLLLMLPWGEWLRLNFPSSREDWTRQLYKQTVFIYASLLLLSLFPSVAENFVNRIKKWLDFLSSKGYWLWLPCLLFFVLSWHIGDAVFQHIPLVQDSAAHLFQAKIFSRLQLYAAAPPAPDFFSCQGDMLVTAGGRWFSIYAPGFPLLLAAAMLIRCEWLLSPLLGSLTLAVWIAYANRWHGRQTASLLGFLFLFSPFLLLMSSTVMVHTPELFIASAAIYLCRRETETSSSVRQAMLFLLMMMAVLVRVFSLMAFLAPVLAYICWARIKEKSFAFPASIVAGILAGSLLLAFFQWKTTGNPALPGYLLEYPEWRYGFGENYLEQVHTPARGLEHLSNFVLGLNRWLTGWYSGSLFFVILFFLLEPKLHKWDLLLLLSGTALAAFYYFAIAQDMIIGPRLFFVLSPVLLLMIARSFAVDRQGSSTVTALLVVSCLSYLPVRFPELIHLYAPSQTQLGYLSQEISRVNGKKTLVFLDPFTRQDLINWNDPFLQQSVILCRDLQQRNVEAQAAFPEHRPMYFRLGVDFQKNNLQGGYRFYPEPDPRPPGYMSLFELAMTLQSAADEPDHDFFDVCYEDLFQARGASEQLAYLQEEAAREQSDQGYREDFRFGIIHTGRLLLLPKVALEKPGKDWASALDKGRFRLEFQSARIQFENSGEVGKQISAQFYKVGRRIDRNLDRHFSDAEIVSFLSEKIQILQSKGIL